MLLAKASRLLERKRLVTSSLTLCESCLEHASDRGIESPKHRRIRAQFQPVGCRFAPGNQKTKNSRFFELGTFSRTSSDTRFNLLAQIFDHQSPSRLQVRMTLEDQAWDWRSILSRTGVAVARIFSSVPSVPAVMISRMALACGFKGEAVAGHASAPHRSQTDRSDSRGKHRDLILEFHRMREGQPV